MIVYALIDPRDGAVRYVGKTHRTAHRRLRRHLAPCYLVGDTHKERWVRVLLRLGLEPEIRVLERCDDADLLCERERAWIALYQTGGAALTNATPGGDGRGRQHTAETKSKISASLRGRPKSAEHRRRTGEAQQHRRISPETRAKMSASAKGRETPRLPGDRNGRAKLTPEQVEYVRSVRGVVSQRELARRFGVSNTAIRYAQTGRNWGHLRIRELPQTEVHA